MDHQFTSQHCRTQRSLRSVAHTAPHSRSQLARARAPQHHAYSRLPPSALVPLRPRRWRSVCKLFELCSRLWGQSDGSYCGFSFIWVLLRRIEFWLQLAWMSMLVIGVLTNTKFFFFMSHQVCSWPRGQCWPPASIQQNLWRFTSYAVESRKNLWLNLVAPLIAELPLLYCSSCLVSFIRWTSTSSPVSRCWARARSCGSNPQLSQTHHHHRAICSRSCWLLRLASNSRCKNLKMKRIL